ncbi:hypothetical protein A2363_05030 [Candidatus Gottesmanbacteria bacterium RIFOXYB1_FULL_47_11]|uniref:Glycosyl transferase family 1 domain-containing protein n=1 Tax=Candidatus Gottesmanbacteria bacterium RIFOXYB1_FULL_47_11 TaxID=1798401 RepID=A0A1F6BF89_9BACT|nr:MAG: hypothetical protein A2363_05030 [Candidatus Gottesmanbacteria bacterium RIFOXYB1_FULL_47_11]
MKIGLLLPSLLMAPRFSDRIFAPKDLFLSLAAGLKKRGHDVHVYDSGDPQLASKEFTSVKIRKGGSQQLLYRLNATEYEADISERAFREAAKNNVEIMHIYMDSIAQYFARISPIPAVTTIHDPVFPEDSLEGWHYRHFADMPHVAISRRQQELYGKDFTIVGVVHHGVDTCTFPFSDTAGNYLAFVGRLIEEKGLEDALAVGREVHVPLQIATSGNYFDTDYYKNRIEPLIHASGATMTGFMQKPARDAWMKKARALLFPIHWEEPFGMVMIEAMACGTPVIAYNRGSVPEIIRDGVTGFVVDEKEGVDGLVKAIKRIGEIDRAACRRHVEENFTVEKMVEGYEKVYQKILSQQPA